MPTVHIEANLSTGELLLRINQELPDAVRARYEELHARQGAGTLEPEEHEELLRIITGMEDLQAQRAEDLARLAQLRGATLSGLLDSRGIRPHGSGSVHSPAGVPQSSSPGASILSAAHAPPFPP